MGKRSKYVVSLVLLSSLFLAACQNGNQDNETDSSAASSAEQVINVQLAEMAVPIFFSNRLTALSR